MTPRTLIASTAAIVAAIGIVVGLGLAASGGNDDETAAGAVEAPAPETTVAASSTVPATTETTAVTAPPTTVFELPAFPDASTTGVPDGIELTPSESVTVTEDGAVIEGLDVTGRIVVDADDVTIRNTRVRGNAAHLIRNNGTNLLVEDVTLEGEEPCAAGIAFNRYTANRIDVSGCADGLKANNDAVITNSWIHDQLKWDGTHNDGIQGTGGTNIVIRGNRIEGPLTQSVSAIKLDSFNEPLGSVVIENNLISGGGYAIYLEAQNGLPAPTDTVVANNFFIQGTSTWDWLTLTPDQTQVFDNNRWDDGTLIPNPGS